MILAGGRGTRFWPRSRRARAKQVLTIFGERSLIQSTVDRLEPLIPPERLWVLTNEHLREEIVRQLPAIPRRQILAEPVQRNTAAAIGLAAHILHSLDRDAVMGVFPSDHVIAKPRRYLQFARAAFRAAAGGKIAVLGIAPRWAETGYGYIEFPRGTRPGALDPAPVRSFREKPDARTAARYRCRQTVLLERGHVLLACGCGARGAAPAFAQDRDAAGFPAPFLRQAFQREA